MHVLSGDNLSVSTLLHIHVNVPNMLCKFANNHSEIFDVLSSRKMCIRGPEDEMELEDYDDLLSGTNLKAGLTALSKIETLQYLDISYLPVVSVIVFYYSLENTIP